MKRIRNYSISGSKYFILGVIFLVTVIITFISMKFEQIMPSATTMADATLPTVAMDTEAGTQYNVLHGYTSELDSTLFYGNITPVNKDRKLAITINTYGEDVELSDTKLIIPAGYTDASVTLGIKNMDVFQSNYDEATYNLGVRATVQGYKMPSITLEAKALIKKEAYVATGFLEGKVGNKTTFEHTYFNGEFKDTERNLYTFSVQLDRPARKDVKVKLTTEGVDDEYLKDISITPAEIIIPAGEKTSGDITWEITNDFLLRTSDDSSNTLNITAVFECEDPVFVQDEKRSSFTLNINKYIRGFEHISYKRPSGWIEWAKQGWSVDVEDSSDFYQNDGGGSLIDGETKGNYEGICSDGDISFTLDMGEEKTITGVGLDYIYYYAPQNVQLSVSSDGNTWNYLGKVATADENADYYQFIESITARYVKFDLLASWGCELYEIYVFK